MSSTAPLMSAASSYSFELEARVIASRSAGVLTNDIGVSWRIMPPGPSCCPSICCCSCCCRRCSCLMNTLCLFLLSITRIVANRSSTVALSTPITSPT